MFIYRIEHPETGHGPYNPRVTNEMILAFATRLQFEHADDDHPSPWLDGIDRNLLMAFSGQWRCAFRSVADAHAWFGIETLRQLRELGYVFAAYKVEPNQVQYGEKQVVFLSTPNTLRYVRP